MEEVINGEERNTQVSKYKSFRRENKNETIARKWQQTQTK